MNCQKIKKINAAGPHKTHIKNKTSAVDLHISIISNLQPTCYKKKKRY